MNNLLSSLALASLLVVGAASSVAAQDMEGMLTRTELDVRARQEHHRHELLKQAAAAQARLESKEDRQHFVQRMAPNVVSVPELDPSAAASAVALLIGGALVISGARRRHAA